MYRKFLVSLCLVPSLLAGAAAAAPASAAPASSASTRTRSYASEPDAVALDFSGALATVGGSYGGTFLAGVSLPVERGSSVRLNLDSGIMFSHATWLPILLSVVYNIGSPSQNVRPYVGGAVGPFIRLSSTRLAGIDIPAELTGDGVRLGILLRPGLRVALTRNLDLLGEIPLGGITGIFYISPTLGMQLKL